MPQWRPQALVMLKTKWPEDNVPYYIVTDCVAVLSAYWSVMTVLMQRGPHAFRDCAEWHSNLLPDTCNNDSCFNLHSVGTGANIVNVASSICSQKLTSPHVFYNFRRHWFIIIKFKMTRRKRLICKSRHFCIISRKWSVCSTCTLTVLIFVQSTYIPVCTASCFWAPVANQWTLIQSYGSFVILRISVASLKVKSARHWK